MYRVFRLAGSVAGRDLQLPAALLVLFLGAAVGRAQTGRLIDGVPGATGANPQRFIEFGGFVWYAADTPSNGVELWRTDGTPGGTALFADIATGPGSSNPQEFAVAGGLLYFQANNGANGAELWRTDGTPGGTQLVADVRNGILGSNPRFITGFQGNVYFQADDGVNGTELWFSDGTPGGTALIADIQPGVLPIFGPKSSNPSELTVAAGLLFFRADDGSNGVELWAHDGFTTALVSDIFPGVGLPFGSPNSSFPLGLTEFAGFLVFVATDLAGGTELWFSDGTGPGTLPVVDLNPGSASSLATGLEVVNGVLYFSATDGVSGEELWSCPDPFSGVSLVADIVPGSAGSQPQGITAAGTLFYFSATTPATGRELFVSDGSTPGTFLVEDIRPGAASSTPAALCAIAGGARVVFRADDGVQGAEPWSSDGTPSGTFRIVDVRPCAPSSNPSGFAALGARAIFAADDGSTGAEAWATDGLPVAAGGTGQAPRPGLAVLDINASMEIGGAPVCSGLAGPYFAAAASGSLTTFAFAGAPNQPIVLLAGTVNPGVVSFGAIGQVDIGTGFSGGLLTGVSLVASGTNADILSQLFRTSASGSSVLSFTTPSTLAGQVIGFQAFFFNGGATVVSLSNAVQVTFS